MRITNLLKSFLRALGAAARAFWFQNRFNDCAALSFYALLSIVPSVCALGAVLCACLVARSGASRCAGWMSMAGRARWRPPLRRVKSV